MAAISTPARSRPEALTVRVEELLAYTRAGRIRVPAPLQGFRRDGDDEQPWIVSVVSTLLPHGSLGERPSIAALADEED